MSQPLDYPSKTARFALPLLFSGQAQKEFTVNEAISRIAALLHASVEAERAEPPTVPPDGQCWLVAPAATGAWEGRDGSIATYAAGDWLFVEPLPGLRCHDLSTGATLLFDDGWRRVGAPALPIGGSVRDEEARTSIAELLSALGELGILPSAA